MCMTVYLIGVVFYNKFRVIQSFIFVELGITQDQTEKINKN